MFSRSRDILLLGIEGVTHPNLPAVCTCLAGLGGGIRRCWNVSLCVRDVNLLVAQCRRRTAGLCEIALH